MTLSHHDHDTTATPTTTGRAVASQGNHISRWVWGTIALIVVLAGGLALAAVLGDSGESTVAAEPEALPEYEVDTPVVLYAPPAPAFFSGADANLDPDMPSWYNTEYGHDTAAVFYAIPAGTHFVGGDANLDPDSPVDWQSEYDVDTALVVTTARPSTHFVGGDANLDPDS